MYDTDDDDDDNKKKKKRSVKWNMSMNQLRGLSSFLSLSLSILPDTATAECNDGPKVQSFFPILQNQYVVYVRVGVEEEGYTGFVDDDDDAGGNEFEIVNQTLDWVYVCYCTRLYGLIQRPVDLDRSHQSRGWSWRRGKGKRVIMN